jgi:cell envelope opacity-associated protein A
MGNDPAKPDFSNVQSGSATSAPDFSNVKAGSSTTAPAAAQSYTVVSGDTLSKIAKNSSVAPITGIRSSTPIATRSAIRT